MSSQATAWHHITGRTPESLLVKLKYYIEPSVKDPKSQISQQILVSS